MPSFFKSLPLNKNSLPLALFFIWGLWATKALGQNFTTSLNNINFQTKNEKQLDSVQIQISNLLTTNLNLRARIPFQVFGSKPFWLKDSSFSIPGNSAKNLWVYCQIKHNLEQKAFLILQTLGSEIALQSTVIELNVKGRFSKSYYSTTENLTEEALKQALKARLAQGYNSSSYDAARDELYGQIDNLNDSVTCVYTLRKAKFNTRSGAASNNFNCEHTFPQGFFNQDLPMRSDLHHLFSTDDAANNSRGNLPFGIAIPPLTQVSVNAPSKNGGGKYEPQDLHKGNCARAMMYFVLRYQDYTNFFSPQNQILRTWHNAFPPTPKDTMRNQKIFSFQNNRNPFVDYPQFSDRIKNLVGNSISDSLINIWTSSPKIEIEEGSNQQNLSLAIWNQGNKKSRIRNLRFAGNRYNFVNNSGQNTSLGFNEASIISFASILDYQNDTLLFDTDHPVQWAVSIPITVIPSTRNSPSLKSKWNAYPNPAGEFLTVEMEGEEAGRLEILDAMGRSYFQLEKPNPKENLNLAGLPQGLYWLKLTKGDQIKTLLFTKK